MLSNATPEFWRCFVECILGSQKTQEAVENLSSPVQESYSDSILLEDPDCGYYDVIQTWIDKVVVSGQVTPTPEDYACVVELSSENIPAFILKVQPVHVEVPSDTHENPYTKVRLHNTLEVAAVPGV